MSNIIRTGNAPRDKVTSAIIVSVIGNIFETRGLDWSAKDLAEIINGSDADLIAIIEKRDPVIIQTLKTTGSAHSILESVREFFAKHSA